MNDRPKSTQKKSRRGLKPIEVAAARAASEDGRRGLQWHFTLRQLRRAYDAARSPFDAEFDGARQIFESLNKRKLTTTIEDEYPSLSDYEDSIQDRVEASENSLNLLKQGFALILYHSWERQAVDWANWIGIYKHGHTSKKLVDMGYAVNPGVNKLNKVANCIKHNSDRLWNQNTHRHMFHSVLEDIVRISDEQNKDRPDDEKIKPDYARYLRISDGDMDEFFDSLAASGPMAKGVLSL